MNHYDVIIRPLMSEKAFAGIHEKKYVFVVNTKATKIDIKNAVEAIFEGVKVEKVNTVNVRGKLKRQGATAGYTSKFKKAYVMLTKESKAIAEFESLA